MMGKIIIVIIVCLGFVDLLEEHAPYCTPHGPQKLTVQRSMGVSKQVQVRKQLKVPFVMYLDRS